ncbi:YcaO-like family protein [Janthinobacterium sp. GW460P]|uniref:YcaO-like family protein n=1 Tax=unclassified Janthinobacterium TaxID=2610881 RepID=UPI000A32678F|nr:MULTISPECIES: YcaO-like family protein [unclassified Janthinobacterium]MCC7705779.1 YcaO-like family protein [Janthinobacterium sp. GW460P]MCC7711343.1 YcaO-like family protein [Janthinobacterium sp. GW460W]
MMAPKATKAKEGGVPSIDLPLLFPASIPLGAYRVIELASEIYLATQEVHADERCPNGVFSTSVAVDRTPTTALQRSRFEAAERYATAALRTDRTFFKLNEISLSHFFKFPYQLPSPLDASGRTQKTEMIQIAENINCNFTHAAIADVYAPYPVRLRESSWHPTTNGVAVGQSTESAKYSSFCEYLERHSIMDFWYCGRPSFLVDSETMDNAAAVELKFLTDLDYQVTCVEISEFSSIYVVLAFISHCSGDYPAFVCAAGTSQNIKMAIRKALQEIIQTLIACASNTKGFSDWEKSGEKIELLEHRMHFFAASEKAKTHRKILASIREEAKSLSGRVFTAAESWRSEVCKREHAISFIDITPTNWNNGLSCVRCLSSTMIPLIVSEAWIPTELAKQGASRFGAPHPFP